MATGTSPQTTERYATAFQRLKDAATKLQALSKEAEPDVDQLEPLVEQATQAYAACNRRIEAVRQMLDAKFSSETPGNPASPVLDGKMQSRRRE